MENSNYRFESDEIDNGTFQYKYIGEAPWGVLTDMGKWNIYRFTWSINADNSASIAQIQLRSGVAWDNRDSLDWSY